MKIEYKSKTGIEFYIPTVTLVTALDPNTLKYKQERKICSIWSDKMFT